jgi:hypothetical protein
MYQNLANSDLKGCDSSLPPRHLSILNLLRLCDRKMGNSNHLFVGAIAYACRTKWVEIRPKRCNCTFERVEGKSDFDTHICQAAPFTALFLHLIDQNKEQRRSARFGAAEASA